MNVSDQTIKDRLKNNGVKIRNLRDSHLIKRFNENYFDIIDTEDKAYFLGFIYADGNVRINIHKKGYKSYITSIAQMEKEPLEKFIKCINGENIKISEYLSKNKTIVYSVSLNSKTLFDSLVLNGCIPNKSLILEFPKINDNLINHFIRGYFDGDGSVFKTKNKVKYKTHSAIYEYSGVSICGTYEFLSELKNSISHFLKGNLYKEKRKSTNTWYLRFDSNKTTKIFYEYLYKESKTFLQRKKNKFEQLINERGSTTIIGVPKRTPSHLVTNRRIRNKV